MYTLEAAISKADLANSITLENHQNQAEFLHIFKNYLSARYIRKRNIHDLVVAISKVELVVSANLEIHLNRARFLHNLGKNLLAQ